MNNITSPQDLCGKHTNRPNKIPVAIQKQIKEHIRSFPSKESHYSRKDTSRKYLSSELSVAKMHELYLEHYEPQIHAEWCLGNKVKPQVGYDYYRNIFNTSFNLAFGRPRSDTCCTCDELNIAIQAAVSDKEKKRLETKLQLHHRKAKRFYEEMKKDTLKSKLDPSFDVVSFDFQQNLPLPYLPVNKIFYLRQLWLYVFGIHVTSVDNAFMYCWDESVLKCGCNEVISCLHHYIQHHLSSSVKTLHIYSDGCAGQNKNRIVMAYLFHLVKSGEMEEILHLSSPRTQLSTQRS